MALQAAYQQFLAAPNSASLSPNAALYYITTTTIIHGPTEIIVHLNSTRKQVKKTKEAVFGAVESANGLAVEMDTTLDFLSGGGPYLPSMDDNFLADHTVHLPITHFVSFDGNGKIAQIRLSWDQGALLKQIDVIGKSGRNWPIRDSVEQAKVIASAISAIKANGPAVAAAAPAPAPAPAETSAPVPARGRGNSALRDPHASLELFAPKDDADTTPAPVVAPYAGVRPSQRDITDILNDAPPDDDAAARAVISPYAGRRPRQRSFTEILGEQDDEAEAGEDGGDSPSRRGRSRSPTKAIAPKAGANKNFQPMRLFEADEAAAAALDANSPKDKSKSPERVAYRPNPKRYDHFDFADGSDPQDAPKAGVSFETMPASKHGSHWSFEDFVTPQKPPPRALRGQEVRHFAIENDEMPATPSAATRKVVVARPRPDAEAHFEFKDDGEPSTAPHAPAHPRGVGHNQGLGLYENNLYKEDGSAPTPPPARALGNITNLKDRSKMFDAHFTMTDEAPPPDENDKKPAGISDDRKKAVKMMESSWTTGIDDPDSAQKENNPLIPGTSLPAKKADERGIQIFGDGMGGKKSGRSWSFGDDEADEKAMPAAVPGKKQGVLQEASNFWDF